MSSPKLTPYASNWLNFLRWFSAFLVISGHLRSIMFTKWQNVQNKSFLTEVLYLLTRFGHEAVVVFFVISGWLVGSATYRHIQQGTFNFGDYFIARFFRIYMVLIPALVVGAGLDYLGFHYFNAEDFYNTGNTYSSAFNYSISERLNSKYFFANILMLQNHQWFSTFGSNSPLWSLAYEWFYYLLFPIIMLGMKSKVMVQKVFFAGISIGLFGFMPVDMRLYFFIWLIGVSIPFMRLPFLKNTPLWVLVGIVCASLLISEIVIMQNHVFATDWIIALFLAIFLSKIAHMDRPVSDFVQRINRHLAGFSYSVYVLHMPIIVFFTNLISVTNFKLLQLQPSLKGVSFFFGILILNLVICYIFSIFTEQKTDKVKRAVISYFKNISISNNFSKATENQ
jgi:peptidoglycan/LPS O-acetylase OafA/YrhL